jgi:hypothetical protein
LFILSKKLCKGSSIDLETLVYKSHRQLQAGSKHREPNGAAQCTLTVAFLISNAVRASNREGFGNGAAAYFNEYECVAKPRNCKI